MLTFRQRTDVLRDTSGFTLVEMLVVMTLMALIAVVGTSMLQRRPNYIDRQKAAVAVKMAGQQAQHEAHMSGRRSFLELNKIATDNRTLRLDSAAVDVQSSITFYPDGSSTGGTVLLDDRPLLRIDWLTGEVIDAQS